MLTEKLWQLCLPHSGAAKGVLGRTLTWDLLSSQPPPSAPQGPNGARRVSTFIEVWAWTVIGGRNNLHCPEVKRWRLIFLPSDTGLRGYYIQGVCTDCGTPKRPDLRGGGKSQQGHPVNEGKWGGGGNCSFPHRSGQVSFSRPVRQAPPAPPGQAAPPQAQAWQLCHLLCQSPSSAPSHCWGPNAQGGEVPTRHPAQPSGCTRAELLGQLALPTRAHPHEMASRWGDRILAPQPTQEDQPPPSGVSAPAPFSSKLQIWFVVRSRLRGRREGPACCPLPSGLQAFGQEGLQCPNGLSAQLPAWSSANVAAMEGKAGHGAAKTQRAFASRVASLSSATPQLS